MRAGLVLWMSLVFAISCGNNERKVTRDDCAKVADHISDLVMDHYSKHTDELWDEVQGPNNDLPPDVRKETLAQFLATPIGNTWLLRHRGMTRTGMEAGIDPCVQKGNRKQIDCLLAATSRDAVTACDSVK
jgi:hypothetical protein